MTDFRKSLLIQIGSIVGILTVFFIFGALLRLNIIAQVNTIVALVERKTSLSHAAENLAALKKDWEIAKRYEKEIAQLVPSSNTLVAFSANVKEIATANNVGINLSLNNETKPNSASDLGSIGFEATLNGQMAKIISFIIAFEKKYYAVKIDVIDATAQNESGDTMRVFIKGTILYKDIQPHEEI